MPLPHSFDYLNFIVSLKIHIAFFLQFYFSFSKAFLYSLNFHLILESACQFLQNTQITLLVFDWDFIALICKSIFRACHLNNVESSYPRTWCISSFICLHFSQERFAVFEASGLHIYEVYS